jgi:hypothetical protein
MYIVYLASYYVGSDMIPKSLSSLQFLLSFLFAEYLYMDLFQNSIWSAVCKSHENNYVVHYPFSLPRMFYLSNRGNHYMTIFPHKFFHQWENLFSALVSSYLNQQNRTYFRNCLSYHVVWELHFSF